MVLPFSDARLRLSLPWSELSALPQYALIAVGIVAALMLVAWLYRRELRSTSRGIARTLLVLRSLIVLTLLALLLTDPTLIREDTEPVPGRVIVALDLSDSMRVSDPNRDPNEKLRLAKHFRLATDLAADSELDGWAKTDSRNDGERARYVAVLGRVDKLSRLDLARKVLERDFLKELKSKHDVELIGFCPDVMPLSVGTTLEKKPGSPLVCSDLKLPLTRAIEGDGDRTKLLGVILLTDGRHNWGQGPLPKVRELGESKTPVHSIIMAPDAVPADVAILSARPAAATVFKGSSVPVEVAVRVNGWPARDLTVSLETPDTPRKPIVETIRHSGADATYPITLRAKMDEIGPQRLVVKVNAGGSDRFPANNTRTTRVNVVKDRARVMLIDGEARWEFHYVHTCLGRDPNMDVRSIVFRQPRIGAVNDNDLRTSGIPARTLPENLDILTSYDAIVIGDVEVAQMTPEQRKRIEHYVSESGGTLVISAGKRAMPLGYLKQNDEVFTRLLPIKNPEAVDSIEGFAVNLTAAGERNWFLSMADTSGASRAVYERFPLQHWAIVGTPKDGAEVLATGPKDQPVITRQNYGFGRVLFVGFDATWRWRYKAGDTYHHRFWSQAAQWAASDRLLPVSNASGSIRFGPREPVTPGGQDVEVIVRTSESVKSLPPAARKAVRIIRLGDKDSQAALVPLTPPEGRPRDLQAKVPDLVPGKYAIELDIPEWASELVGPPGLDGRPEKLRAFFEVEPPDSEELIDLSANRPLLTEMAEASGGKVVTPESANELVELLNAKSATRPIIMEHPVRSMTITLVIIVMLFAAEWSLRKWVGLP